MNEDPPIPNADDPEKGNINIANPANPELDNTGTKTLGATDTVIPETIPPAAVSTVITPAANTVNTEQVNTKETAALTNTVKPVTDPNAAGGGNNANLYIASNQTPDNTSGRPGVIALGIYLLLMIFISVYMLGGLMLAETDTDKVCARLCGTPTPTPTPTESPSPTPTATPTVAATPTPSPSATTENKNGTTGNTKGTAGNSGKPNNPTGDAGKPNNPTGDAGGAAPSSPGKTATPTTTNTQDFPDITVPKYVYVNIPAVISRTISADSYVFLVVLFAGMLGGVIRAIYSFIEHLGLKNFAFNWTWFYISLPFSGAALSVVIYFVIRGGFYGGSFGKALVLNVFSFAALGALTGLFTEHAMEKLKQVANTLLADVSPKVDNAKDIVEQKEANQQGKILVKDNNTQPKQKDNVQPNPNDANKNDDSQKPNN